jgi:hypothetical protein
MKPFNLQEAIAGKPLVTKDGREVKRFTYLPEVNNEYKIVAVVDGKLLIYTEAGHFWTADKAFTDRDLFMKATKVTRWVNLYRKQNCQLLRTTNEDNIAVGCLSFESKEDALSLCGSIGVAEVSWED